MRFFDASVVIIISLPLQFFSPSLAFSFSSRHRGRSAARAVERRQEAVGTGNDDSHAVQDEFVLRRKKSIAAAVMGAATAQFSATKVSPLKQGLRSWHVRLIVINHCNTGICCSGSHNCRLSG